MANEEQLSILKQGVEVWNKWRKENPNIRIDLSRSYLRQTEFRKASFNKADLSGSDLSEADLSGADFRIAKLRGANLRKTVLIDADFRGAELYGVDLSRANLSKALFVQTTLSQARLIGSNFSNAQVAYTSFGYSDLRETIGLESIVHGGPSSISTDVFTNSKGKIPEVFLRGCGLSDWEIAAMKLYDPSLSNYERDRILGKVYMLTSQQARQISPLFISYSHADSTFVDKLENDLTKRGIRFWRDIHDATSGRLEKQIDRAIHQNPTVLLILSSSSIRSDWVEHEVRTARELEKVMGRDALCPVALDDSWKSSPWPQRLMDQIMEYNILDFSEWQDNIKFDDMFRKLVDGLELFYKG